MSEYVTFFLAREDSAAVATRNRGPVGGVVGSFFSADDAVVIWESLLTGRSVEELWETGGPRVVAPWVNDGSAVFALSDELTGRLLHADAAQLEKLAAQWSAMVARDGDELAADVALRVVTGVAGLAHEAVRAGWPVYCRVAC
ncbi:hypothetical protein [Winogradskya humida]|uniref:Uncharacterized protein n=1 Tax=Winogradskya humida TaxID=113566 RepID=A0ABQ3ZZC7_9ACTN|nr:hypothetical protein [Actinoplanes humidus]GIE23937.1 hypothetical protein Ahu01nite_070390 [Actinoplanes humidus]